LACVAACFRLCQTASASFLPGPFSDAERNWNIKIPGYSSTEELKPYKRTALADAHKQRLTLVKKAMMAANQRGGSAAKK
jgi:transcription initiation factor TFIID subunit TAF12